MRTKPGMPVAIAVLCCLGALLWVQPKPRTQTPEQLVFTNVNVVDTREGGLVPNMTVVIRDGHIEGVARVGLIGRGRGLHVINATGKYLIPGLWDMHVHSAFVPGAWDENIIYPLYIANGVTGVRDMGGDPDLLEKRRQRIEHGELLGPRMVLAGPFLSGGKSDAQTIAVNTPAQARQAVDSLKKQGVDFVKILSNISPDVYKAIAEQAAKDSIRFVGHVPDSVSAAEASAGGQRSIEHLTGILLACSSQESELRQRQLQALSNHDHGAYSAQACK